VEEFPSNSQNPKIAPETGKEESAKKVQKIISGEAVRRKKSTGARFKEMFFGDDTKSVVEYVFADVLIPAARDMIVDAFTQGLERMVFGEVRSSNRRTGHRPTTGGYTSYNNRYASSQSSTSNRRDEPRTMSRRARGSHDFDEIILPTRSEAEGVIDRMYELLEKHNAVSVSDLYELVGIEGSYVDEKWGWTDLRGADARRVSNGYLLNLPRTTVIS
jgi:hypothetical protein